MTDNKEPIFRRSFLKACAAMLPASIFVNRAADVIVSVDRGDRGELFDADGRKIEKCIEANLTTGRCVVMMTDRNGKLIMNSRGDGVDGVIVEFSVPMRFKRRYGGC